MTDDQQPTTEKLIEKIKRGNVQAFHRLEMLHLVDRLQSLTKENEDLRLRLVFDKSKDDLIKRQTESMEKLTAENERLEKLYDDLREDYGDECTKLMAIELANNELQDKNQQLTTENEKLKMEIEMLQYTVDGNATNAGMALNLHEVTVENEKLKHIIKRRNKLIRKLGLEKQQLFIEQDRYQGLLKVIKNRIKQFKEDEGHEYYDGHSQPWFFLYTSEIDEVCEEILGLIAEFETRQTSPGSCEEWGEG